MVVGRKNPVLLYPHACEPLKNIKVQKVACGRQHTLILTATGELLTCGSNEFGQCGNGKSGEGIAEVLPVRPDDTMGVRFIDIGCGLDHSMALTEDGRIYSWGYGTEGQLGHGTFDMEIRPRIIDSLLPYRVASIAGGGDDSFAITGTSIIHWRCRERTVVILGCVLENRENRELMDH